MSVARLPAVSVARLPGNHGLAGYVVRLVRAIGVQSADAGYVPTGCHGGRRGRRDIESVEVSNAMTSGTSPSPRAPRTRHRMVAVRTLVAAVVLTLAGSAVGAAQQPSTTGLDGSSPAALSSPSVEDRLRAAEADVRQLSAERDRLQDALAGFADLYDAMESDRQLLLELRKTLPSERTDAETYLTRMQTLALRSDPTRLSQLATRVQETAPVFLDWRHDDFATPAEANQAYLESGASGFDTDFEEFRTAILLTVANRLDALLTLQDRIR